jgi:HK97 family phage major capsid protein
MKDLLDRLIEQRATLTRELRAFFEDAEQRNWTAEDRQEFERRNHDLDDLDQKIQALQNRVRGDAQVDEYRAGMEVMLRPTDTIDPNLESPHQREERALADFFTGRAGTPNQIDVSFVGLRVEGEGRSKRVIDPRAIESRATLLEGALATGGATFAVSFRAVLYQHLIFNSAIRQTRATVLTTATGENMLLPKTTAHPASGTIVAEGALIGESDPAFGQGTLSAYKYANLVQISTELEQDTAVDLLGYVAMAMGRSIGNGAGAHYVTGTGTGQPQGVLVGAGAASSVAGGTPAANGATFNELLQVYDKIIPPYQINGEWFMSQTALSKVRGLVNTQGSPIFVPALSGDMPDTLFGKPVTIDPNMPAVGVAGTSIAFGDFSPYFIRDVEGVRFERSVDFAFGTDLVTYKAVLRSDGRLLDLTGAIATYKGGAS